MSDAEEIDSLILRILLNNEHGRRWLEQRGGQAVMESGIERLLAVGLDREVASQMWIAGNVELVEQAVKMTPAQIAAVNDAWRQREASR